MSESAATFTLFLCGDVMTGRGIDQILPRPSRPGLFEPVVKSALEYVALAERANGKIPWPVSFSYPWGVALEELRRRAPAARIINLETSITASDDALPKGINYRMHPSNVGVLSVAAIDCATLANNHVLDWGVVGLRETLDTLARVGIRVAGCGRDAVEAAAPAVLPIGDSNRVLVFAYGAPDAGVSIGWRAGATTPGVNWLADWTDESVARIASDVAASKRAGDLVVASIHWGPNWGYEIPDEHRRFAHALVERAGVDVLCGHSSHHAKAIEVHRGRLILYGCGDFLDDYEGIAGHEEYRDDLPIMYLPTIDASGALDSLELVPLQIRNFSLRHPLPEDLRWLRATLDRECRQFGAHVVDRTGALHLEWR